MLYYNQKEKKKKGIKKMFMYFYELGHYESRPFDTEAEAEAAYDEIAAEVASIYGYCDPDYLMHCEVEE